MTWTNEPIAPGPAYALGAAAEYVLGEDVRSELKVRGQNRSVRTPHLAQKAMTPVQLELALEATTRLHQVLDQLQERLRPAMLLRPDGGPTDVSRPEMSEISHRVAEIGERIDLAASRVTEMLAALDI